MTEQTATQTPAAPTAPSVADVAAGIVAATTIPEAGTVTEREFLAGLRDSKGQPLAVTESKGGGPARGRFSTLAKAVLTAAEDDGFVAKVAKPKAAPRVAKTTVRKPVETLAEAQAATPHAPTAPVEPVAPVTRSEGTAWGFMSRLGRGRKA